MPSPSVPGRDVDQPDEMDAVMVEAIPAFPLGFLAESLEVLRVVADDVVLAGHIEDLTGLHPLEDLCDGVELIGCREMGEVAGVDQKVGRLAAAH